MASTLTFPHHFEAADCHGKTAAIAYAAALLQVQTAKGESNLVLTNLIELPLALRQAIDAVAKTVIADLSQHAGTLAPSPISKRAKP